MSKTIFVTGGSGGIGSATVRLLADRGNKVIFTYNHSKEAALNLCQEIALKTGDPNRVIGIQCDLANGSEVRKMMTQNKDLLSGVDVLVNNAGSISSEPQFLLMANMDNWWKILYNNIACVVNVVRGIAPYMIRRRKGMIINMSSISGLGGDPGQSAYAASKAAIANLTKSLNKELSSFGIIVNSVSPGLIDTRMAQETTNSYRNHIVDYTMAKRLGKPAEVASLITYLALDAPSYLVNQNIEIAGGL